MTYIKAFFSVCIFLFTTHSIIAQNGDGAHRYFDFVFDKVEVTSNIVYSKTTTIGGKSIELEMDIYEPKGDKTKKRPVLVFAHGGGFVGGHRSGVEYYCDAYAKRGFGNITILKLDKLVISLSLNLY